MENIKTNLLEDISTLTTVQKASLDRLSDQSIKCICHNVQEALLIGINEVCIDIGLGNLFLFISENEVKYRFEPSYKLENNIIETLLTKKSPVISDIEESLINKINVVYKELF